MILSGRLNVERCDYSSHLQAEKHVYIESEKLWVVRLFILRHGSESDVHISSVRARCGIKRMFNHVEDLRLGSRPLVYEKQPLDYWYWAAAARFHSHQKAGHAECVAVVPELCGQRSEPCP